MEMHCCKFETHSPFIQEIFSGHTSFRKIIVPQIVLQMVEGDFFRIKESKLIDLGPGCCYCVVYMLGHNAFCFKIFLPKNNNRIKTFVLAFVVFDLKLYK